MEAAVAKLAKPSKVAKNGGGGKAGLLNEVSSEKGNVHGRVVGDRWLEVEASRVFRRPFHLSHAALSRFLRAA
jgi:hypothetical protein